MNFDSFSHGQIESKIWLCDQIEPFLPPTANIVNLGGWYNVLGFMLKVRNPRRNLKITNIDADPETKPIADRICDALDTRVTIQGSAKKGTIVIEFAGAQDLQRITKAIEN